MNRIPLWKIGRASGGSATRQAPRSEPGPSLRGRAMRPYWHTPPDYYLLKQIFGGWCQDCRDEDRQEEDGGESNTQLNQAR